MSAPTPARVRWPLFGRVVRATITAGAAWLVLAPALVAPTGATVMDLAVGAPMSLSAHGDAPPSAPLVAEAMAAHDRVARRPTPCGL